MNEFGFVMVCLAVFVILVVIARLYNHLVLVKHNVQRAWSDISVLLKQRQDEIRKLVAVCREHAGFEKDTLERVTRARGRIDEALRHADPAALGDAEQRLRSDLDRLLAVAEAYPELRAAESFRSLSQRISQLETAIADRRTFYNATVKINNNTIQSFPELLLAGMFGFRAAQYLMFDSRTG